MKTSNFQVIENWIVNCPECDMTMTAPFNEDNPMQPMKVCCEYCAEYFIVTYERE
jgi:hypothetical protein